MSVWLKKWWEGEVYYIEGIIPGQRFKRHWTSKLVHSIYDAYHQHRAALIIAVIASMVGALFTILVS